MEVLYAQGVGVEVRLGCKVLYKKHGSEFLVHLCDRDKPRDFRMGDAEDRLPETVPVSMYLT